MTLKNPSVTKEDVKNELIRIYESIGKVPTSREFYNSCTLKGCYKTSVSVLFGRNPYSSLLEFAGLELNIAVKQKRKLVSCHECGTEFLRLNSQLHKSTHYFCNKSCAAKFNNPFKAVTKVCKNCNKVHERSTADTCSTRCSMEQRMKTCFLQDLIKRNRANRFDTVRQNARAYSKYVYPKCCMLCGYNKHYEVCHVRSLSSFVGNESLFVINNKSNLIHLCSNCHWEFDHGMISEEAVRTAQNEPNVLTI